MLQLNTLNWLNMEKESLLFWQHIKYVFNESTCKKNKMNEYSSSMRRDGKISSAQLPVDDGRTEELLDEPQVF